MCLPEGTVSEQEKFIHRFFDETSQRPDLGAPGAGGDRAPLYKAYPEAPAVKLTPPDLEKAGHLFKTISERRSVREFAPDPISLHDLSLLIWAAQGLTFTHGEWSLRASPSAGAEYPVETYIAVNRAEKIEPGIYHFNVRDFSLERLREGSAGRSLADACMGQNFVAACPVVFIWTGIYKRVMWRYGKRGLRYIFMDAGHIGENVHLAATAMGLGCCAVGAFYDDEVAALLGLDGRDEFPLYLSAAGRPRSE